MNSGYATKFAINHEDNLFFVGDDNQQMIEDVERMHIVTDQPLDIQSDETSTIVLFEEPQFVSIDNGVAKIQNYELGRIK